MLQNIFFEPNGKIFVDTFNKDNILNQIEFEIIILKWLIQFEMTFEMLRLSHISTLQKSIYQTSLSWKQQTMSAVTFYFWILLQILKKWCQDISICPWIIKRTFMAFIWGSRSKIQRNDKTGRIYVARFHEKNVIICKVR